MVASFIFVHLLSHCQRCLA